jgi:hypothetical protein
MIAEDGVYGPQTEARLSRAPSDGFATGAVCMTEPPPDPGPDPAPDPAPDPTPDPTMMGEPALSVAWTLESDGIYTFDATAPEAAERVAYSVDGRSIGEGMRAWGNDFAVEAGTCADESVHRVDAHAVDMEGNAVADAVAWLEARDETAAFVRPTGEAATYEIGVDRPARNVAAIEVEVDGHLLTDDVSGDTRATRRAVHHTYSVLGMREVVMRLYDASGALVDERDLAVELR